MVILVVLIAKNVVPPENQPEFLRIAKLMTAETRKEPGCIFYDCVADTADAQTFYFIEKYTNEQAVAAHRAATYFQTNVPKLQTLRKAAELHTCSTLSFE